MCRVAARWALIALLIILGSCKKSSSVAGSHLVLGLGMTLVEAKGSSADPFDVTHYLPHYDLVASTRYHPVTIVGVGSNIEFRGCEVRLTTHDDRVKDIHTLCELVPATRKNAEMVIDGLGQHLIAAGWRALRPNSELDRTYVRDIHLAAVRVQFMNRGAGTDIAGEKATPGQRWVIDFDADDNSNGR